MKPLAETRVRCSGHLHTIVVGPRGRIGVVDPNGNVAREHAMSQLAGDVPRCTIVLQNWTTFIQNGYAMVRFPEGLCKAATAARALHGQRGEEKYSDWIADPRARFPAPRARFTALVRDQLHTAAHAAVGDYRQGESQWVEDTSAVIEVDIDPELNPSVEGISTRAWSANGKWSGTVLLLRAYAVPMAYLRLRTALGLPAFRGPPALIYEKKLKRLPIALAPNEQPTDGSLFVLAGRQSRGLSIVSGVAHVVQRDGKWVVKRWLKS